VEKVSIVKVLVLVLAVTMLVDTITFVGAMLRRVVLVLLLLLVLLPPWGLVKGTTAWAPKAWLQICFS